MKNKKIECSKCLYGEINFWGHQECWKFDEYLDLETTTHTAIRERDCLRLNRNNDCPHFEKKGFVWLAKLRRLFYKRRR